jgi:outer membrane protein
MKKLILGLFVLVTLGVNAQIESGKLIIGGSFGFGIESNKVTAPIAVDGNKTMNFNLMPEVGFCLSENLAIGMGIGYDMSKTTSPDFFTGATATYDQVSKNGLFMIKPFGRYYKSTGEKSFAFAEFALPIGMGSSKDLKMNATGTGTEDSDPFKTSYFGALIGVGFNYFLNDKCALEAKWMMFGFESTSFKNINGSVDPTTGNTVDSVSKQTNFGFDADMTALTIGLKVFL